MKNDNLSPIKHKGCTGNIEARVDYVTMRITFLCDKCDKVWNTALTLHSNLRSLDKNERENLR